MNLQPVTARRGLGCRIDAARLAERLWIGSAPATDKNLKSCGFDSVVLAAEEFQPRGAFGGTRVLHAGFNDSRMDTRTADVAMEAAREVVRRWRGGERVLVTCMAGRNRSGLVSALSLMLLFGMTGKQALRRVQSQRDGALTNPHFAEFLTSLRRPPRSLFG